MTGLVIAAMLVILVLVLVLGIRAGMALGAILIRRWFR